MVYVIGMSLYIHICDICITLLNIIIQHTVFTQKTGDILFILFKSNFNFSVVMN